ncbi:hypothetical protein M422DRAFT_272967 [Sphaerobolus stellatus SS14]|uniref:Uncharacterized protein n=1 Tax=Sphaerobolus stellatus (strain SS14) TaxID=990650 RepID=A0A0C9TW31_SPHS4|nr:hypothetical protein M422DRAFT_272967 [Sphaerobolus stellatus SS14]
MPYHHPITDEQLALFLDAAKSLPIPANKVPPPVVEEVPVPSTCQNPTILAMNQALIAETIKMNANNAKEYKERKEQWYHDKAEDDYKAEEDAKATAKAVEEENECARDANLEGEDEVDQDEMPKSKSKSKKMKLCPIVASESEEETKEVKAKRRKGKGKGKAIDTEYK